MKNIKLHLITIFIFTAIFTLDLQAQVTVTSQVFAEVVEALTASETSQLNFGKFFPQADGGQIEVSPEGTRQATGSTKLSGGTSSPASYEICGADGVNFTVILPPKPAVLSNADNSKTMTIDNWQSSPSPGQGGLQLEGGTQQVKLGATLNVGSLDENPVGMYAGTFSITFSYN